MSAAYAPNMDVPKEEFPADLPIDIETEDINWENFERWMAHDPLTMIEDVQHQQPLRDLMCSSSMSDDGMNTTCSLELEPYMND